MQLKTLQTKLKLTDEQAAEMDLLGVVRKELARQRAENGEPEEVPNPDRREAPEDAARITTTPRRRRRSGHPFPKRRRKPPQLTEVEMLRREMAKSRAKAQVLEKEMCSVGLEGHGRDGPEGLPVW